MSTTPRQRRRGGCARRNVMRNRYNTSRAVVLGSLLVLGLVIGVSAAAWAGNVTACGDFSASTETRFDLVTNITTTATTGFCLTFPPNAAVNMNGFAVIGSNIDNDTAGIILNSNSFLSGPGIIRGFGVCVGRSNEGVAHVAIEGIVTNWCGT